MSVIAAATISGETIIGSNTGYVVAEESAIDDGVGKWILFGDWALGVTGSMQVLNILRNEIVGLHAEFTDEGSVVKRIGNIFTDHDIGYKSQHDSAWKFGVWCILAHKNGRIWDVDETLSLGSIPLGMFWARGSGEKYAIGAAHSLTSFVGSVEVEQIVRSSIEAAIANDLFCPGAPFLRKIS